jgi:hypothetical protein
VAQGYSRLRREGRLNGEALASTDLRRSVGQHGFNAAALASTDLTPQRWPARINAEGVRQHALTPKAFASTH